MRHVLIRCFPHDDRAFAALVSSVVGCQDGRDRSSIGAGLVAAVARLRLQYPLCRLVLQDELATIGDVVIYAYRDGNALRIEREGPGAMRATEPREVRAIRSESAARGGAWRRSCRGPTAARTRSRRRAHRGGDRPRTSGGEAPGACR